MTSRGILIAIAGIAIAVLIWKYVLPPQLRPAMYAPRVLAKEPGVKTEKATFAAGCFWGVEATFRDVPGVVGTQVGYSGGSTKNPTYEDVCTDSTGHAEAVEVEYDPQKVSYDTLLDIFWANHDPTTLNRQGPDVGDQYRSVIFYHSPEQQAEAMASKERQEKSGHFRRPIVTQIVPEATFYRAEEYHQQYLEKRGLRECHIKTNG
jgi:peptide-methionine (S)-S-oxide reductase